MSMPASSPIPAEADNSVSRLALSAFRAHARELQRFLMRRVGDRHDVDDLSQEVFARLLRVENADLIRSPLAYLLGIATHVIREFRQRRQHPLVVFDSEVADTLSEQPDARNSVSDADQMELRNWLEAALQQLPPTHQLVLLLVKRDGLSYEEASDRTGLSVHTIEKYLVEARARLRLILKDR